MKNVLLFEFISCRPKTQTPVESDADTFAVLAPLLIRLEANDIAFHQLILCRPLSQQPSQVVTMTLSGCWRH